MLPNAENLQNAPKKIQEWTRVRYKLDKTIMKMNCQQLEHRAIMLKHNPEESETIRKGPPIVLALAPTSLRKPCNRHWCPLCIIYLPLASPVREHGGARSTQYMIGRFAFDISLRIFFRQNQMSCEIVFL